MVKTSKHDPVLLRVAAIKSCEQTLNDVGPRRTRTIQSTWWSLHARENPSAAASEARANVFVRRPRGPLSALDTGKSNCCSPGIRHIQRRSVRIKRPKILHRTRGSPSKQSLTVLDASSHRCVSISHCTHVRQAQLAPQCLQA